MHGCGRRVTVAVGGGRRVVVLEMVEMVCGDGGVGLGGGHGHTS